MKANPLSIDLLRIDCDTQSRLSISEDVVEEYSELIEECSPDWEFPPLDVFHDGTDYYVADGFHRLLAAQRAKRGSVPCIVRRGTAKDARIFGMTANDRHGLRMTRDDKRSCVEWLLDNGGKLNQSEIASKAGVSKRLVQFIVAERKTEKAQIAPFSSESRSDKGKPGGVSDSFPSSESSPVADGPVSSATAAETEESDGELNPGTEVPERSHTGNAPPADSSDKEFRTQKAKTVKTVEALMRCFDDLHRLRRRDDDIDWALKQCRALLQSARNW